MISRTIQRTSIFARTKNAISGALPLVTGLVLASCVQSPITIDIPALSNYQSTMILENPQIPTSIDVFDMCFKVGGKFELKGVDTSKRLPITIGKIKSQQGHNAGCQQIYIVTITTGDKLTVYSHNEGEYPGIAEITFDFGPDGKKIGLSMATQVLDIQGTETTISYDISPRDVTRQ